jgi:transcriptional regulator with XRE-family HTH domain
MARHGLAPAVVGTVGRMARPKRQRRRWFLKQWREHRQLSQEALAERVGMTQGMISHLENNRVDYTATHLEMLADALRCEPVDLLIRNPTDPEAPWSIWDTLQPVQKRQAVEIMKTLKRTGTE